MFKRLFSLDNPLSIAISAAIILTLSPKARRGTKKVFVKGAAALLFVGDQMKGLAVGARKQLGTMVKEAHAEKEQMALPEFSAMFKKAGESTKSKMASVFDEMKFTSEKGTSEMANAMEIGEEFFDNAMNSTPENMVNKQGVHSKMGNNKKKITKTNNTQIHNNVYNVLNDNPYKTLIGKPPIE
jgi:hypothetical protein